MKYLVIVAILLAALIVLVDLKDREAAVATPPAAFQKLDYPMALERARREKKVVMIDFTARWCGPCKKLDLETFAAEQVKRFLTDRTIAIKIDIDDNRALASKYQVATIPCLVFIDAKGEETGRLVGYRPAAAFLEEASQLVK
jgi:thiol:disulfide interchange protein